MTHEYPSLFLFSRFFNYRGRGGYYNRNAMNTGGYRGGNMNYNRGGSYHQRSYRNYNSNSTGIPQQKNKTEQSEAAPAEAAAGKRSFSKNLKI